MSDPTVVTAVLGWSNPDTGPLSLRLYATDQGDDPRWAKPHARVAEQPFIETGATEGDRFVIARVGNRFAEANGYVVVPRHLLNELRAALFGPGGWWPLSRAAAAVVEAVGPTTPLNRWPDTGEPMDQVGT
jgi:hypothetical protein